MVYYYANHKLRDVFFFSALHNISAFNFHKKTQALSQPQQNWHLCTEKLYSCQFLSCEVLSKSCVCCFPPHMQLTPFLSPHSPREGPYSLQWNCSREGAGAKATRMEWGGLSRVRQAPGCHFCATLLCLPAPRTDGSAGCLLAWPQYWCCPQKRGQWELQGLLTLERAASGWGPPSTGGWSRHHLKRSPIFKFCIGSFSHSPAVSSKKPSVPSLASLHS